MVVIGLTLDPKNQSPVVMLRERRGGRELHIRIGVIEASSIAFELEQVRLERPLSYDLLRNTVEALGGEVARVHIVGLREDRFAALLVLHQNERAIELDARPSDGIALALRARAPIFCDARVLDANLVAPREARAAPSPATRRGVKPLRRASDAAASPRRARTKRRAHATTFCDATSDAHQGIQLEHLRPEAFGKYKQ